MNSFHDECMNLVHTLWHTYLFSRSKKQFEQVIAQMDEGFVMIGTGKHEFYENLSSVLSILEKDQQDVGDTAFEIVDEWYAVQEVTEDVCMVYGTFWIREKSELEKHMIADMDTRFTVICRRDTDGVRLCSLHHSVSNIDQRAGEFYPKTITDKVNEMMHEYEILENRVQRDLLTGLYNRSYAESYIDQYFKDETCSGILLMLDIDNFKTVNDTLGHLHGDLLLKQFAKIVEDLFFKGDVISRVGGDEFLVLMKSSNTENAAVKAHAILRRFNHYLSAFPTLSDVGCSIGIAAAPRDGMDFKTLYRNADRALYTVKNSGKHNFAFHHEA